MSKEASLAALIELEAMGYRFELDGDSIRYSLYGGEPPPGAGELLRRLDREQVRMLLQARQAGCTLVKSDVVRVSWPDRYLYLLAIREARDAGKLSSVRVTYIRATGECVYELMPPGVDLDPYLAIFREVMA